MTANWSASILGYRTMLMNGMLKMRLSAVLLLSVCGVLGGCQSPGMVSDAYLASTRQIEMGMSKPDFFRLFPTAEPRGAKMYPKGSVEVYEVKVSQYRFMPSNDSSYVRDAFSGIESKVTWFYFYNGILVQYGMPNDWPAEPDKVIEIRQR